MKNLENIIFSCAFYSHNCYIKIHDNIFFKLNKYYEILKYMYDNNYKISVKLFKDIASNKHIDTNDLDNILDELENEDDNFDYYLEKYLEKYNENKLNIYFNQFKAGQIKIDDLKKLVNDNLIQKTIDNLESFSDIYSHIDFEKPIKTVKTGFQYFDIDEGGFRNGELIFIAARTSIGKTSLMKQLVINNMKNKDKSYIISLEMSKERIIKDILSTLAGVSKRKYAHNLIDDNERFRIDGIKDKYKNDLNTFFINDNIRDIDRLYIQCKKNVKKYDIKIIYIDYIQIIEAYGLEKKELRIKINYITNKLQSLAKELNVPVVCLAQLSRKAEEHEKPRLSDLKECGKIEEDADVVILLWKKQNVLSGKVGGIPDGTEIILGNCVAKNRNGATGDYYTYFNRVTGYIEDTTIME